MNKKSKLKRLIGGSLFTVAFVAFAIISCSVAVQSKDIDGYQANYGINAFYGYDRVKFLTEHGRLSEIEKTKALNEEYGTWDASMFNNDDFSNAYNAFGYVGDPSLYEGPADDSGAALIAPADNPAPAVIAAPDPTFDPNSPAARAAALGLPAPPDIDISQWQYVLVSAQHPLEPQDYAPENLAYLNMTGDDSEIRTGYDQNRQVFDMLAAQPLVDFAQGCRAAGLSVYLSSGYRSYSDQLYLFNRKVSQGYSEDVAKTIVAYPGTSEHQTGLCCDITDRYYELKDSSLENTATYKWLYEHCSDYGFILRYPADKSGSADSVTGCIYEPWHFRYVGKEAAQYIMANNLCLEEFVALYK